jgi:hypothetical protein
MAMTEQASARSSKLDDYLHAGGLHTRFDLPHSTLIFGASLLALQEHGRLDVAWPQSLLPT